MTTPDATFKQAAIDYHTELAGHFADNYRAFDADPYPSTFTYGRKKLEELIDRVTADFGPGTRVLDAGCGTGFNLSRFARRGFVVSGVEPSPTMRAEAIANNPGATIVDGDIERLPFADGSFDLVISIEVVRYLADPSKAFAEMARVLRPGGMLLVSAAPKYSLAGYALVHAVTSRVRIPTFQKIKQSFMTVATARRYALDNGFASVDVHGAFLGPWLGLQRISRKALALTLKTLEPLDDMLADRPALRDFTNHLLIVARR